MNKLDYGEILFIGRCNCNCYYCLGNEMHKLRENVQNNMNIHFKKWINFGRFISILKECNVSTIYLSSTISEPLLYTYIDELVQYLKSIGFKVGIRTNGYYLEEHIGLIKELDAEVSLSINSFKQETTTQITGNNEAIDWNYILDLMDDIDKKCRVSIVVNQYNYTEVMDMLDKIEEYRCVTYVQLRRIYKYSKNIDIEDAVFERTVELLRANSKMVGNFHESEIYGYKGLKVSLWRNVFKKENIASLNYFTDGLLTDNTLLVPAYERGKDE